jgi:predicted AAA+ superfamily ATPase
MIRRNLTGTLSDKLGKDKAIVVIGPRQVGKTTLINNLLKGMKFLFFNGDDPTTHKLLTDANTEQLRDLIGDAKIVFIDEAQRIKNISLTCKIIQDQIPGVQLIISGSSAFELANETNEPLTGRKWEYKLYPISWQEFEKNVGLLKAEQQLELRVVYGMYPDVINHPGSEQEVLQQLTDSYLYKDILAFSGIRKPELLQKLLSALAYQIGNEVSYNELSNMLQVDKNTISSYISLLEQAYVVYRLPSFSRNLRNEIKTNQKIYFYDTGIRNMVIGNLNPLVTREDKGSLWENFLLSERLKTNAYTQNLARMYFWRTKTQQEIDCVEEKAGTLSGYEFKWNEKARVRIPESFLKAYNAEVEVIHRENFRDFIKQKPA